MGDGYIINRGNIDEPGRVPMFTYTGKYDVKKSGDKWVITCKSSGTLVFADKTSVRVRFRGMNGATNILVVPIKTLEARQNAIVRCGPGARTAYFYGTSFNPNGPNNSFAYIEFTIL